MSIADGFHAVMYYKRICVRDGDDAPWRWFDAPVAFTLAHHQIAMHVFEAQAAEAVFRYPTQHIRAIEAPSVEAFDRVDWAGVE